MNNTKRVLTALALAAAALSFASGAHAASKPSDGLLDLNGGPGVADRNTLGSTVDDLLGTNHAPGTTAPGSLGNDVDRLLGVISRP
ncbi:hypothetical protein ABZY31_24335 [Streptomyces sp. NPDC006529]|uniref:hypothetical protein n=1 Tax=Streptomyces sp. NPDC006529 TaxID=3157177 RepID=UPI0033A29C9B